MSQRGDDYGPPNTKQASSTYIEDNEPADPAPDVCDHDARRELPLAPLTVKIRRIPDPLIGVDGKPVTVEDAGETYLKVQRANWKNDALTSKYERHRFETYPRILEADRHFQMHYDGVTTAMLTRRLSPLDDIDSWLTPWECNEMLHGGRIHRSVRNALAYQLDAFRFEWVAVTAPTESAGTPHEHIYLWIEDPENEVTTDNIAPALEKHLKYCANAYEEDHRYRADGSDGAIRVEQEPPRVNSRPEKFSEVQANSQTYEEYGKLLANTRGAQYLASQLTHLPIRDFYDRDEDTPPQTLFEGAALAWASPRDWFRAGRGVPAL
jgi:hypothetical protein